MKRPAKHIKHQIIYESICSDILKGLYKPGQKLPTENELAEHFHASRPTVGRAMRDLQQKGLITRRQGQGTFVRQAANVGKRTLGLLVHWQNHPCAVSTMTTIFGIMVPEILKLASDFGYSLLLITFLTIPTLTMSNGPKRSARGSLMRKYPVSSLHHWNWRIMHQLTSRLRRP